MPWTSALVRHQTLASARRTAPCSLGLVEAMTYEQRVSSIALGENPRGKRAGLLARSFYMTLIRNVAGRHTSLTTYAQWPTGSTHDSAFYTLGSRW